MPTSFPRGLLTDDALPLYGRTAARLWEDLAREGARPGDRLPGERVLAERYAVSRVTVRAALTHLQERGLLEPAQGRGWTVVDGAATEAREERGHSIQGFADYARENGLETHADVLLARTRPAGHDEVERLRIGPGAEVFELRRLRYLDGRVVALELNRLPLALCPELAEVDFTTASLYATLRSAREPQVPGVADYAVEARQPDPEERRLLQITGAVPLLVATQLTFNTEGQPLEWTDQAYRGDRYRFRGRITN